MTTRDNLYSATELSDILSTQRRKQKAIMVFKSLHGLTPGYLSDQFTNRNDVTNYSLRDSENKLAVPLPRTNFLKNSFSYEIMNT